MHPRSARNAGQGVPAFICMTISRSIYMEQGKTGFHSVPAWNKDLREAFSASLGHMTVRLGTLDRNPISESTNTTRPVATPTGLPRAMNHPVFASLSDFHLGSRLAAFPQVHRSGGTEPIQLIKTRRSESEVLFPSVPELVLGIVLDGDLPFRFDLGFGWSSTRRLQAGDIRLCLPNTEARYECGDDYSLLLLCLPASMIEGLLCQEPETALKVFEPLHMQTAFRDDVIQTLASQIWSESVQSDPVSGMMVDGLVRSLVAQLLRRADPGLRKTATLSSAWPIQVNGSVRSSLQMARVRDYIEAHLAQPLSVPKLATEAGMSPSHFSRWFKAVTGQAVWAYVQRRRCERAREMLQFTGDPIAAIAHRCGFASQAHLTSSFKRIFGVTPARIRQP